MKKKLLSILAVVLVASFGIMSVSAADAPSDASITLVAGDLEIVDPGVTPPAGYEEIKSTQMNFGTRKITGANATHQNIEAGSQAGPNPENETGTPTPIGFMVTDARGGDGKWEVSVKGDVFKSGDTPTLAGYKINLAPTGTIIGPTGADSPNKPTAHTKTFKGDLAPVPVLTSNASGSNGIWGANWDATIDIVGGTEFAGQNKAVVTWSVIAIP